MANGTCSIDGCERANYCRGWCATHYARWQRLGDPGPAQIPFYGESRRCSIEGCDQPHEARGWCHAHYIQWKRTGDPLYAAPPQRGPAHPQWKSGNIGYLGMHLRIARLKGKAKSYSCIECGAQAQDWAYDHADPSERIQGSGSAVRDALLA